MTFTNTIAEHYIASAILNEPEKIIPKLKEEKITSDYFHTHLPKTIWRYCEKLFREERTHEIELLEFSDEIKGLPNGRELTNDISNIRGEYCGWEIGKQHLKVLKNMTAIRFSYAKLSESLTGLQEGLSAEEVADNAKEITQGILTILESESGYKTAKQGAQEFKDLLVEIHNNKSTAGTTSGIPLIDQYTGGLGSNELWVVGAETSGGKTVLMFQIMASFLSLGKNVLLFSLETEASRIHARLASNTQSIHIGKILGNSIEPVIKRDFVMLKEYIDDVIKSDCLTICDSDSISLESISAKAEQISQTGKKIDLIVVDYIQLVTLLDGRDKSRQEQVSEVSRTLKQIAKKYKCPVITATQLNDNGMVRESRAITHDADVYLKIDSHEKDPNILLAKNRNGERNVSLDLRLNGAYQRFE
jgi:replicative DNA helicase